MSRGEWLRGHRKAVLAIATILLGLFLPLPGIFLASLIWPAGVHDLDGSADAVAFLGCIFVGSAIMWGALLHLVLPRSR